jgi:thioredoxin-related protein
VISAFAPNTQPAEIQAYDDGEARIKWMSLQEAAAANAKDPKMIFIDFYTDWCSWCKKMDANTFSDPKIATLMTSSFYAVKFNAETDEVISFNGKEYSLNKEGRRPAHEIAIELATHNERLGYPTFVVLDEDLEKLKAFQGYKTVDALKQILEYYGDKDNYTKMNWMQFIQSSQSSLE